MLSLSGSAAPVVKLDMTRKPRCDKEDANLAISDQAVLVADTEREIVRLRRATMRRAPSYPFLKGGMSFVLVIRGGGGGGGA